MRVDFFLGRGPGREWLGYLEGEVAALAGQIRPVLDAGSQEAFRASVERAEVTRSGSPEDLATVEFFGGRTTYRSSGTGAPKVPAAGASPTSPAGPEPPELLGALSVASEAAEPEPYEPAKKPKLKPAKKPKAPRKGRKR